MKCLVLGDSISEGIGSKKINYIDFLVEKCSGQYDFVNMAKTGTTIKYAASIIPKILSENADIIIIMYGSVDAQIRPNIERNRWKICNLIPHRYKIGGMLSPRAFYSSKKSRIIPDRVDNMVRLLLKNVVLITQGVIQWVAIEDFEDTYEKILSTLKDSGVSKLILVSTVYLDNKYFLNSNEEYEKYNYSIRKLSQKYQVNFIDLYSEQKNNVEQRGWGEYYSCDHFHPNPNGYRFIANLMYKTIIK